MQPRRPPIEDQLRPGRNFVRAAPRAAIHDPFTPPMTAAKIRTAIDDAVFYLRSLQHPDGSIGDGGVRWTARRPWPP